MSDVKTGAEMIAAERARQIVDEGWSPEHDAHHTDDELAWAAACYAAPRTIYSALATPGSYRFVEPWPVEYTANLNRGEPGYRPWRRSECDRITELVKAGALIAAEIDRLQRAGGDSSGS